MKFDTLCNIILEDKKQQRFSRISIVNPSTSFSMDDVLRDPDDPSKGLKTYLDEQLKGAEYGQPVDEERLARRALRRLNWVVGSLIKRIGSRELDLRKLHINIIILLEKYLTNVLRYSEEQIEKMELKIAKEAAFIGNIILPPSEKYPRAKGVFAVVNDNITYKDGKNKASDGGFNVADNLRKEFNMTVDEYLASFDPDLIETIKDIIKDNTGKEEPVLNNIKDEEDENVNDDESDNDGLDESVSLTLENTSISTILKDPRIKNIYDPRIVRKVIKSMIEIGSIRQDQNGELTLTDYGEEDWRTAMFPTTPEVDDGESIIDTDVPTDIPKDIEDEENIDLAPEDKTAATRLGYMSSAREESGDPDIGEEEEDESWYK